MKKTTAWILTLVFATNLSCTAALNTANALGLTQAEFLEELHDQRDWVEGELSRRQLELEDARGFRDQLEANYNASRVRVDSLESLVEALDGQLSSSERQLAQLTPRTR
ncbi:MAG TPA: hypothetical protein QGG59_00640 [Planctomycetota bacterium]|jgi:chromosome segregation ATPase|nr:hypothetical protein [Planctomycetota bacterium]MDP6128831.1 hypothetical protein [Planctomycetota bacterium]MDP7245574.1 hypothetical protein [Planctomycetota bacterium]HJM38599.1 hypothetical protein [Planctomycetota bacterium]|tara:strand:+ start:3309 stop:3635 length:327 start_codon:yes stop_codon:yes gene_type:complete